MGLELRTFGSKKRQEFSRYKFEALMVHYREGVGYRFTEPCNHKSPPECNGHYPPPSTPTQKCSSDFENGQTGGPNFLPCVQATIIDFFTPPPHPQTPK